MLRSCRNTVKHRDTVRGTRDRIATSLITVDENSQVTNSCRRQHVVLSESDTAADGRWFCRRVVTLEDLSS